MPIENLIENLEKIRDMLLSSVSSLTDREKENSGDDVVLRDLREKKLVLYALAAIAEAQIKQFRLRGY